VITINRILIIQTAFIGDVVLATPVLESLYAAYPNASIDFLVKKGNDSLFKGHPFLNSVIAFDKTNKLKNTIKMCNELKLNHYDIVVNLHRHFTSGLFTVWSGAKLKLGFKKNPLSAFFTYKAIHEFKDGIHEVDRNLELLRPLNISLLRKPKLYLTPDDIDFVQQFKREPYICIAPASVWETKKFPEAQWILFLRELSKELKIYLLGGNSDKELCERIKNAVPDKSVEVIAGKLSMLQSAALMRDALMNYVNDSGPLHFASAVNAPVTAIYCSTVPAFGFGPLSDNSHIIESKLKLDCKPCGIHGFKACPEGHFKCGTQIETNQLIKMLNL